MPATLFLLAFAMAHLDARAAPNSAMPPDAAFAPLWLYDGAWQITRAGESKPDALLNSCARIGTYMACQQTVNGKPSELLVFVPKPGSGEFYTQSIMPDGRAGGRGELKIEGDHWAFTSNWNQGGSTTFYKTLNTFSGKNRIHFEQQESSDNKNWKTTGSGDDVRTAPGRITNVR